MKTAGHDRREFEVIRDPLWDNIRLDSAAIAVLDTPAVQRLRYVRQLGHAFLVYPGATHSRFEHALGAYHLTRLALSSLEERGELGSCRRRIGSRFGWLRCCTTLATTRFPMAWKRPDSHPMKSSVSPSCRGASSVSALAEVGIAQLPEKIGALIRGHSASPLQGLISGSLDLDKIDYLSRDARMCGVPYGAVDVDRLLAALTLVEAEPGRWEVGVLEKGISALESLLFAKYQMYRNVYWHHAVRSATCMFKRAVRLAARAGVLEATEIGEANDGGLMTALLAHDPTGLAHAVHTRRLHKRALDLPASDVGPDEGWTESMPDLLERLENQLAAEIGLNPGDVLVDYPERTNMLSVNLPLRLRDGSITRLTDQGRPGQLGLPQVAGHLYQSARRLRVFVVRPVERSLERVAGLVVLPAGEIGALLDRGTTLLD